MRKELFDKMIQGFTEAKKYKAGQKADVRAWVVWDDLGFSTEEADRLESVYLARRTDKRLQQATHLDWYFSHHGQVSPYDFPDYTFSNLQDDLETAATYAAYGGDPEDYKDN